MARFNKQQPTNNTTNLAGGQAYSESPQLELISLLLTSFANDQFYRKADTSFDRLKQLMRLCDKKFVAQAIIYARTKFGMRSISHVAASELAKDIGGQQWAKSFYNKVIHRPDDMIEIVAYHFANKQKLSHGMRNGFAEAFQKFDAYQIGKYRGENRDIKLVDLVRLVHPKPHNAITALVKSELTSTNTWESALTQAGQEAETEEQKVELKKDAWARLIREKKIGYFALLKNLRNILEQAPEAIPGALELLTDQKLIRKSLLLPFRFTTAYEEIEKLNTGMLNIGMLCRKTLIALNTALEISLQNVPVFEGETLVVLDVSSSMNGKPSQIGSLFAAVLLARNNCDFIAFETHAKYINYDPNTPVATLAKKFRFVGGGTNFPSIFATANKKYDRIIILSDMQGWIGNGSPKSEFNRYKQKYNADPFLYSFDLQGYGSLQFPEQKVFALAGFSDKVFDLMRLLETDRNAMINEIKKIEL